MDSSVPADYTVVSCPDCGQRLKLATAHASKRVRCGKCQREFTAPGPSDAVTNGSVPGTVNPYASPSVPACRSHPLIPAQRSCATCQAPMCDTCSFPQADGRFVCPTCASRPRAPSFHFTGASQVPPGVMCSRHAGVQAVHYCKSCRKPVCVTCDFALPGNVHVCPDCASKPQTGLSPKRRNTLIWSYVCVGWCTLLLGMLLSGVFNSMLQDPRDAQAADVIITNLILLPSLVGTALAVGTFDRRLPNPASIWVSMIWNGVILAGWLLLMLFGAMSG